MANVRIRGKIPREEWPKIAARFQNGETLTEIARSYHCTAPAIRYIVGRVSIRGGKAKMDRDKLEKVVINLVFNALKFTPPGGQIQMA